MRSSRVLRRVIGVAACSAMAVGLSACDPVPKLTVTPTTMPATGGTISIKVDGCPTAPTVSVGWSDTFVEFMEEEMTPSPWTGTYPTQEAVDHRVVARCGTQELPMVVVDLENPKFRLYDPNSTHVWDETPTAYGSDCPAGSTATVTVPRGTPRVVTAPIDAQGDWRVELPPIAAAAPGRTPKVTLKASCGSLVYPGLTFDPQAYPEP